MAGTPKGRFGWHELYTSDPVAAQAFYTNVIGWTTQIWEGGPEPYTMWVAGEVPMGGVMKLPPQAVEAGAPPNWVAYVTTPDADATIARAKQLGGSLVWGPFDVPTVGRFGGLTDPQGAHFAILQPSGDPPGHDGASAMGEVSWHELATTDWEAAWAFYSDLFDWQKADAMDMGEMGTYQMFGRGAHPLGGLFNKPPQIPVPNWLPYVRVPDLDASLERVRAGGGQVLNGPMEVAGGDRIAQCMDPQGAAFALHESSAS